MTTLKASLSIANVFKKDYDKFLIVDLYAGKGVFDDGSAGSPLIALQTYEKSFYSIKDMSVDFMFVEKDEDSCASLSLAIDRHKNIMKIPRKPNIGYKSTKVQNCP